jgi:hypothetical protein
MGTNGTTETGVKVRVGNEVAREEFGAKQLARTGETASTALATQARAAVEARFVMAMQRPRNMERVRVQILEACKRPFFAEDALYSKPVGKAKNDETGEWEEKFVEGLSIRFAEEAVRLLGNAMTETVTIYDDPSKRIVRLSATDLETNVVHYKDITVEKTVERRHLKKGQQAIGKRQNSYGDDVFLVEATEDDLAKKEGALGAKAIRDKMLMLIPSDIKEEARAIVKETQAKKDAEDPMAAKRKVIDAFAAVGVMPDQLVEFLGHGLDAIQPAELQQLRAIYSAIKDGETTWASVIDQKREGNEKPPAPAGTAAPAQLKPEGTRISLKKDEKTQAPGAPTTVGNGKPTPPQASPSEPASLRVVPSGAAGAAVAEKIAPSDEQAEEEANRRAAEPSEKEMAAMEEEQRRKSGVASDDDVPPWMK